MAFFSETFSRVIGKEWSPPNDHDTQSVLEDAIGNSILLVMTASKIAIPLDEKVVSTIIETKNAFRDGTLETELESNFWAAYEQAAQDLKPVTIDSIKATYDPHPMHKPFFFQLFSREKIPLSRRCASNYKFLSLITLALLIFIQIYWYIGWSLTSDINDQSNIITGLSTQLTSLTDLEKETIKQSGRSGSIENSSKIFELKQQISEHSQWKEAAATHLENWNQVWSNMDLLTLQPWQVDGYSTLSGEVKRRIQFVSAKNALQALTGYILPILYGLIGACFYILRQLPKEIESLTFSMNSYIDYSLRMAQGPLAGMMISYFFSSTVNGNGDIAANPAPIQNLDAGLNSLSPLAIAFLAGYSVEFIFRFIDKILSSPMISAKPNAVTQKPGRISDEKKTQKT